MTKFEQIGIERQLESESKSEALRNFQHSCEVCCYRGMHLSCDKCSIAFTHAEVIAFFEDCKRHKGNNFKS